MTLNKDWEDRKECMKLCRFFGEKFAKKPNHWHSTRQLEELRKKFNSLTEQEVINIKSLNRSLKKRRKEAEETFKRYGTP